MRPNAHIPAIETRKGFIPGSLAAFPVAAPKAGPVIERISADSMIGR